MAAYPYYRQAPGWGTNNLHFSQQPPPQPNFQPQPNWTGMDYYNAHAINPDSALYDRAWGRVRQYGDSELGVGTNEAKHWHRRAYGGVGDLSMMLPAEIGHAAAYEAYRTWSQNSSLYEPLSGDIERQREGLIGLAIAEASRLIQFNGRPADNYSRTAASEAAAATASVIYSDYRDREEGEYHRSRSRAGRGSSSYGYDDDAYASDLDFPRHRSRSRSRARSVSRSPFPGPPMAAGSMVSSASIPVPGAAGYAATPYPGSDYDAGGAGSAYGGTPYLGGAGSNFGGSSYPGGIPMPIQGQSTPYPSTAGMPIATGQAYGSYGSMPAYGSMPQTYGTQMVAGQYASPMAGGQAYAMPMAASQSYATAPRVINLSGSRPRSSSMSLGAPIAMQGYSRYPQAQYLQTGYGQPQTIIIGSGHRKHHRSKKSKRSRSIDYPRHSSRY